VIAPDAFSGEAIARRRATCDRFRKLEQNAAERDRILLLAPDRQDADASA